MSSIESWEETLALLDPFQNYREILDRGEILPETWKKWLPFSFRVLWLPAHRPPFRFAESARRSVPPSKLNSGIRSCGWSCRCVRKLSSLYNKQCEDMIWFSEWKQQRSLYCWIIVLSPVHTVAEKWDWRRKRRLAEFGECLTFLRQCGQGFTVFGCCYVTNHCEYM